MHGPYLMKGQTYNKKIEKTNKNYLVVNIYLPIFGGSIIKTITDMKDSTKINRDIAKAKQKLITKAKKSGLYENFGNDEVYDLKEKYAYHDMVYGSPEERACANQIQSFEQWCWNFDLSQLATA
jgi:dTDP-glucose pyrophosphorylase